MHISTRSKLKEPQKEYDGINGIGTITQADQR